MAACVAGYRGFMVVAVLDRLGVGGGMAVSLLREEMVGIRLPSEAGVRLRRHRGGGIGC